MIIKKKETDYDGLNDYKKEKKAKAKIRNDKAFDKYFKDKNTTLIKDVNNIKEFTYNNETYYFASVSGLIRMKGTVVWQKFKEFNL